LLFAVQTPCLAASVCTDRTESLLQRAKMPLRAAAEAGGTCIFADAGNERESVCAESVASTSPITRLLTYSAISVEVWDFSIDGFCFAASRSGDLRQHVRLQLNWKQQSCMITGQVRWHLKIQDKFLVGCSLCHREDLRRLKAILSRYAADSAAPNDPVGPNGQGLHG
jgi:hypothetical protein